MLLRSGPLSAPVQMKFPPWRPASGAAIHAPIRRRLVFRLLAYAVVTAGLLGALLLYLREEAIASGEAVLSAFAQLTEDQTTRIFADVDLTLQTVDEKLVIARHEGAPNDDAIRAELVALVVNRPFLKGIAVLDANGRILYGSEGRSRGLDLSDDAFFGNSRNDLASRFLIGLPIRGRTLDGWVIPVTRTLRGPKGEFAGVIVAGVNPLFFDGVWTVPKSVREQATALWTDNGLLLMRSPFDERAMGTSMFSRSLVAALKGPDSEGTYRTNSLIDGRDRVVAYRRLTAYPTLVLSITQPTDVVLGAWWRTVWLVVAGWAVAGAVVAGLATWLYREWSRHRVTEDRYRMLFKASPYPTIALDRRTRKFLAVNDAAVEQYGWSREELLTMSSNDLYPPDDLLKVEALREGSKLDLLRTLGGLRHHKKDGSIIDVEMTMRPIDIDGRPGYLATAEDVTKRLVAMKARLEADTAREIADAARETSDRGRLLAEDHLRQSQKMEAVGQLTGGIAHDFNNILMVILANADELQEEKNLDAATLSQRIERITEAVLRASALTRQLLAFSRKQPLDPKQTDLNDLVSETGKLLRRSLGGQIEIDSVLPDGLWTINIDRTQLETALVNLCVNARDAMPKGGKLLIETRNVTLNKGNITEAPDVAPGDYVMLSVADTGCGMPQETVVKVFEPFFTTKEVGKGTGLGLSMVYGFIKQSDGHITVHSEVGRGTTFRLYLLRSGGVVEEAAIRPTTSLPRGSERILVVEDEPQVRASVVKQLESLGYAVSEAADGSAAVTAFEAATLPYDLLLTDVIMPGAVGGRALADKVARRWPATKIVFVSGYAENEVLHDGQAEDGVVLLSKPFRKSDLARTIRQALDVPVQPDGELPKVA
jgi:PAS domain S-box-containing protein